MGKAIVISANIQKGGSAKTTTIEAIANILGESGYKVLAIDLDPQANLSFSSGYDEPEKTIYEVLKGEVKITEAIVKTKYYDLIPSDILLSGAEFEFNKIGREYIVKKAIEPILELYDFILLDTPPSLGVLSTNALTATNYVIIPTAPSYYGTSGMVQLYNSIHTVKEYTNPNIKIAGILLVRCNDRTNATKDVSGILSCISEALETRIFKTKIRECVKVNEAQGRQVPLFEHAPSATTSKDYRDFVKELLGVLK